MIPLYPLSMLKKTHISYLPDINIHKLHQNILDMVIQTQKTLPDMNIWNSKTTFEYGYLELIPHFQTCAFGALNWK